MRGKRLIQDEEGRLALAQAIEDDDVERGRAVMRQYCPGLSPEQIRDAVGYQLRQRKKRRAEAFSAAFAVAAESTATTADNRRRPTSARLAPRRSLRTLRAAVRDAIQLQSAVDLTLRKVMPNRRGIHSILGKEVPHTAERLLCAAAKAGQLIKIDRADRYCIQLQQPLHLTSEPQRARLLVALQKPTSTALVVHNCIDHGILTQEQITTLVGEFKTAFKQVHAGEPELNTMLLQQVARKDDGSPASKPRGTSNLASKRKDKQSGVSVGDCLVHLGYVIPQGGQMLSAPVPYAAHNVKEWDLFCKSASIVVSDAIWAFMTKQPHLSPACKIMLRLNVNARYGNSGFSSNTTTSDLARGVHTDWGNLVLTAILAIIDPSVVGCPKGGSHTMFGEDGVPAIIIYDSPCGVLFIGPYDQLLHSNLATYVGADAEDFPWYRHSSSWYLKRTVVQHNLLHGAYKHDESLVLLAKCVLDQAAR